MSGTSWAGAPSYLMSVLDPDLFTGDTSEGWLADHDDDSKDRRASLSTWIRVNFSSFLSWKTSLGADYARNTRYVWYGNGTSYGASENGAASVVASNLLRYRINSELKYARYFSAHHLVASAGYEAAGTWSRYSTMNGSDFFSHTLRANGMSYAAAKSGLHEFDNAHAHQGVYASLSYDWNGIVGAEALMRADILREYSGWDPYLYPSGNVYVDLHKALMPSFKGISSLKLSAGYGHAGHDEMLPYEMIHKYASSGIPSVPVGAENYHKAFLRLDTREFNAALNIDFLDQRLSLGVAYYDRLTDDSMTLNSSGSVRDGFWEADEMKEILSRTSTLSNKGFEFDLSADILRGAGLSWRLSANLSYNVNQLYSVHKDDADGMRINAEDVVNRNILGHQAGALYGYRYSDGKLLDKTGNGIITPNDRVIIGNPIPVYVGGLASSFRYHDFTLDVAFDGAAGHDILNLSAMYTDDDPTDVVSDKYVEKGDFLRLKEVTAAYTIPFGKKWIRSMTVSLTGRNLYTLTGYSGFNPDVNAYGTSPMSAGMDYGSWPMARTITLGISVDF